MNDAFWRTRPGLAGGIDKDGSRAASLLASGFGSVEFGTVTPHAVPGHNPGVRALADRLSDIDRTGIDHRLDARIGVSLGAGMDAAPTGLAAEWLAAMPIAWGVADYLCFNLSARAYRPLLDEAHAALLIEAIGSIVQMRERLTHRSGRRVAVLLKMPLGTMDAASQTRLRRINTIGLDALITVLPESGERLAALAAAAAICRQETPLIAVGGIRTAEDVRAVLAAGAAGIQVHGAFVEHGTDCLPPLLEGMAAAMCA